MSQHEEQHESESPRPTGKGVAAKLLAALRPVGRLFGWWLALTGLVAGTSVCPCCGQAGCPMGAGMASFFGLLGAMLLTPCRALLGLRRGGAETGQPCPGCPDHAHHNPMRNEP
jgi:hypothetical protein